MIRLLTSVAVATIVLAFATLVRADADEWLYPPNGVSDQYASYSATSTYGGCSATWSFQHHADDIYAWWTEGWMDVNYNQMYNGDVSGNTATWYYLVSWVYGDDPIDPSEDKFLHWSLFETTSPSFDPSKTYAYASHNAVLILNDIGKGGVDPK